MKQLTCEMCGSTDLLKQDGIFICQSCGTKYSVEEAKRMMIEGTVEVQGTVKVDNSVFVAKQLDNARRAYNKEDWEEVEKYYNLVEQHAPKNMEAVFFSAYGRVMLALFDTEYFKREQKFNVLIKSISVIDEYYDVTEEDKEKSIRMISDALIKMFSVNFIRQTQQVAGAGSLAWQNNLFQNTNNAFITELQQIRSKHNDVYISELISKHQNTRAKGNCYVATAVYGSYDCPQVWTLRRYRDFTLSKTWYGRTFIRTYYAISPTLVKLFGKTNWFKQLWKGKLDALVNKLQSEGVEDSPYSDRLW